MARLLQAAGALTSPLTSKGSDGGLQIFVQDLVGQTCLDLSPDATVADVIAELEKEGKHGQLTWQGEAVQPTASLADLGVCPESVMTLSPAAVGWEEPVSPDVEVKRVDAVHSLITRTSKVCTRAFFLGPEAPTRTAWEWEVLLPEQAADCCVNLYIGVTRPDVRREPACSSGLYSVKRSRCDAEMWMVVNDTGWTTEGEQRLGFRKMTPGTRVRVRYCPSTETLTFVHIDVDPDRERHEMPFRDVRGRLVLFGQLDRTEASMQLEYSGPPRG
eukprot:TRINITY_DN1399_c0_g1_i2.p2 TRINITY_DN1399_c0_g1~~TRINITY_DN1399_c0_g1_i2.p2  ORF type:complete len:273 (+),score=63.27 TRINITY_DN1399_c0_g1_i2:58-876(+)